jgi:biopolymer transport protein ExbD
MRFPDEPDVPPQLNIVPMIDIVFALLTFFIMSTLFLTRSEGLSVNLPKAVNTKVQQSAKATISVDAQGKLFLNKQPIAVSDLAPAVETLIPEGQKLMVVLSADEATSHGKVVEVMDQLRQVPQATLAIATQKPAVKPK